MAISTKIQEPMTPLRRVRKEQGKTLAEVAVAVGCDPSNLSRLELGTQGVTPVLAKLIAAYFHGAVTEMQILYPGDFMGKAEPKKGKGKP